MMMRDTRSRPLEPHTNSGHYSHGRPLGHSKSRVFVEQFDIVNSVCVLMGNLSPVVVIDEGRDGEKELVLSSSSCFSSVSLDNIPPHSSSVGFSLWTLLHTMIIVCLA